MSSPNSKNTGLLFKCENCGRKGFTGKNRHQCAANVYTARGPWVEYDPHSSQVVDVETLSETVPSEIQPVDSSLDELACARIIRRIHVSAEYRAKNAIKDAILCGLLLITTKSKLPHGEFGYWIAKELPELTPSTASRWMNLADDFLEHPEIKTALHNGSTKRDVYSALLISTGDYDTEALPANNGQIKDLSALSETCNRTLTGATQKSITWKIVGQPSTGGDVAWQAWIRRHHPELVVNETFPQKREVPKDVLRAYNAYMLAKAPKIPPQQLPVVVEDIQWWKDFDNKICDMVERRLILNTERDFIPLLADDLYNLLRQCMDLITGCEVQKTYDAEFMKGVFMRRQRPVQQQAHGDDVPY
jgi:hypothetical protein